MIVTVLSCGISIYLAWMNDSVLKQQVMHSLKDALQQNAEGSHSSAALQCVDICQKTCGRSRQQYIGLEEFL